MMTTNADVQRYVTACLSMVGRVVGNNTQQAKRGYCEAATLLIGKLNEFVGHVKSVYKRHGRTSIGKEDTSLRIMPYGRSGGKLQMFWRNMMPLSSLFYS
jgi:hypothetical protein